MENFRNNPYNSQYKFNDLNHFSTEKKNVKNNKPNPYDIEININSILGFLKGWDITISEQGKINNDNAKLNDMKIYSVIGNKNKGKTFLLSKIADRELPNGFSVTTKGLSVSFIPHNNIALFDSVGFESPLLEIDSEEYTLKSGDENKDIEHYKNLAKLDSEIKQLKREKKDIENIKKKENEYFRKRNDFRKNLKNKDEQLIDLTNERRVTDFFLQRFIIENANVILLVVGKLSIDDQFFLNNLTTLIKENGKKFLQRVIVVHNLMTMETKDVVEDYIENTLKKSLTFTLEESNELLLDGERAKKPYNKILYLENFNNNDKNGSKEIIHLVIAKYGTQAGDYYNDSAIDYIKKVGNTVFSGESLDIIEKLKDYFCEISTKILKFETPEEKIQRDNIKFVGNKLILDYKKKIELETFYGDFLSFTFGEPKFIPEYHIVSNDPEFLIIYLDAPGKTKIDEATVSFSSFPNEITTVTIRGKREKASHKTLGRSFGSGNFELKIILDGENGNIKKNNGEIETPKNGFYRIKFERHDNN